MDFYIPNQVIYDMDGRLSVVEAAKSLLGQDKLLREALAVVQQLFPDLELSSVQVSVREVVHTSPFRSNLVAFAIGVYSTQLGEDMPDVLSALTGGRIDVADGSEAFVSLIVLLLAVWVADRMRSKIYPDAAEQLLALEKERLLVEASNAASVPRGAMVDAMENITSKRAGGLRKAAMDFLSPAKRHHARSITTSGGEIRQDAIEAVPSDADIEQYEPPTEEDILEDVVVRFMAHDLQKEKNWAAIIEDVSAQRRPLHLAPDVKRENLFVRREVRADVLVSSVRNDDGDYIPAFYFLTKVYDDKSKGSQKTR